MNKMLISLVVAAGMMFCASYAFAHDTSAETGMGDKFRATPKEQHMKAFPQGHPATENPLNRCFWDEKDSLYFCQYPLKGAN
jgi:hypothetical protein